MSMMAGGWALMGPWSLLEAHDFHRQAMVVLGLLFGSAMCLLTIASLCSALRVLRTLGRLDTPPPPAVPGAAPQTSAAEVGSER